MPAISPSTQAVAPLDARVEAWVRYIRAMENAYRSPLCLPPEEVQAAAAWAARLGEEPPPAPAPQRELVLTR